jgi:hypothetical protein
MVRIKTMTDLMHETGLEVPKIWPIRVIDQVNNRAWVLPGVSHIEAIPTLWKIIHQIVDDWTKEALQYSYKDDKYKDLDRYTFFTHAYDSLLPRYIHCLFSFINFFFLLQTHFRVLHKEITDLGSELSLGIAILPPPVEPLYVKKMRRVRNKTVVHMGEPRPRDPDVLDTAAGKMWGGSWDSNADTLLDINFGNSTVVGASERTLDSIPETHRICIAYLVEYDRVCAEALKEIVKHLPLTIGGKEYSYTQP